jgi:hypothetical protein
MSLTPRQPVFWLPVHHTARESGRCVLQYTSYRYSFTHHIHVTRVLHGVAPLTCINIASPFKSAMLVSHESPPIYLAHTLLGHIHSGMVRHVAPRVHRTTISCLLVTFLSAHPFLHMPEEYQPWGHVFGLSFHSDHPFSRLRPPKTWQIWIILMYTSFQNVFECWEGGLPITPNTSYSNTTVIGCPVMKTWSLACKSVTKSFLSSLLSLFTVHCLIFLLLWAGLSLLGLLW